MVKNSTARKAARSQKSRAKSYIGFMNYLRNYSRTLLENAPGHWQRYTLVEKLKIRKGGKMASEVYAATGSTVGNANFMVY